MEERKLKEIEWADKRRRIDPSNSKEVRKYLANRKYYAVVRKTTDFINDWVKEHCFGKDVFELACGNGGYAYRISEVSKSCTAADIAPLSIEQAKEKASGNLKHESIKFLVLDCENTGLPSDSFDVVCEGGALHHMDINVVFKEVARVLRPGGQFLCVEALRHNPIIQLYRKITPHLRTEWEAKHILGRKEIMSGTSFFEQIDVHFFNLTTILAVPFRNTSVFHPLLTVLESLDSVLSRIPIFRWMFWQSVFILRGPKKTMLKEDCDDQRKPNRQV